MKPFYLLLLILFFFACRKENTIPDPCAGYSPLINLSKTEAVGGASNGTITVLEPRGDSIEYKLDNGSFQASWYYTNIAAGSHIITVRNILRNCSDTAQVTIFSYGTRYAQVKQIITGYCGPCHLNGGISGSMNFDSDASIVAAKDRIKVRTVDGIPTFMPEGSQLTSVDKQKIVDWINAGGTTAN